MDSGRFLSGKLLGNPKADISAFEAAKSKNKLLKLD